MRSPVTLAIFAYNQEKYVRDAIEGAFAQTFTPLEIILSDDGSTDRTFAIMQEMAAAYDGPHSVIVRQEHPNVGTVRHIINVARIAKGDLLVVNAGDDVSYPDRSAVLYQAWQVTRADALASHHDEIDRHGNLLAKDISFPPFPILAWLYGEERPNLSPAEIGLSIPGFCAAYPRRFWADMPDPDTRLLVEDGLASALILVSGGTIHRVPKSLIAYRLLDESASNRRGGLDSREIRARERKIDTLARDTVAQFDYFRQLLDRAGVTLRPATVARIDEVRDHHALVAAFWDAPPLLRLRRLLRVRSKADLAFLLPRMAGFDAFARLRIGLERWRERNASP